MQNEILLALKTIPFLSELSDDALQKLAALAKTSIFPKQSIIISEGDETGSLHILLSGKVRVFTSDQEGKEVTLNNHGAGSYFGELALLDHAPRSASVITVEKSVCGVISKVEFMKWLSDHPDVAYGLIQELSKKVRYLTERVKRLALSNVYERTIQVLQEMSVEENGVMKIDGRPTQQELANMVGASREMVNKIIKELTKGSYIEIEGKTLTIMKKLPASW